MVIYICLYKHFFFVFCMAWFSFFGFLKSTFHFKKPIKRSTSTLFCQLQNTVNNFTTRTSNWRIKLTESKSTLITCSIRNNQKNVPVVNIITVQCKNNVMYHI